MAGLNIVSKPPYRKNIIFLKLSRLIVFHKIAYGIYYGKGFTPKAAQGARVRKGDLLLEFDIDFIKAQGYSIVTPMIITNTDDYAEVVPTDVKEIKHGDSAIQLL